MRRLPIAIAVAVAAVAFLAGALYAGAGVGKSFVNPDAGKTAAQIEAEQKAASDAFWERFPAWIREQRVKVTDPSTLPWAEILASEAAPPQTLTAATGLASVIARGKVTSLEFLDTGNTLASIAVTDQMKGRRLDRLDVLFPGGLRPVPDWDHVVVGFVSEAPIPAVGDDLVLFLTESPTDPGKFEPQPSTGMYWVDSAGLRPLESNPLSPEVQGQSVPQLKSMLARIPGSS
jgi:hypothetical protein